MQNELFLSTDFVEPDLRDDLWRSLSQPFFETTRREDADAPTLEGTVRSRPLASLLIGPTSFNRQQLRRDRRLILQSGLDLYLVQLLMSGAIDGDCDGHATSIRPGDIYACDLARPLAIHLSTGSTLSILLPRERLDKAASGRSLHGTVLKAGLPLTKLLSDFITSLSEASADMEEADALAIEDATISLLAAGLARQVPDRVYDDPVLASILRRRVLEFIDHNLAEPGLGPAHLMRRFRVSRAHLYRMFLMDGGVVTVIREKDSRRPIGNSRSAEARRIRSPRSPMTSAFRAAASSSGHFKAVSA
ncbi:hypothetical protein G5V57_14680 [Nordella sp. HKS 07]|uniref:AraC-like ligand-binding domain-containing protein n=1 Tax=Nordella sp. HKS 07 TaxID=2712222 RepID=UPI0013E17700|nr:hypothetical protein [Nordella sp. HKS 07]QIG48860.1 hypothetical protein G5V57_14680 [Nordella sp. HKS 07]